MTVEGLIADEVRAAVRDEVRQVIAELVDRPLVLTPDEAAHLLHVSRRLVDRWLAAGLLPKMPHTKKVLIPRVAVEAFANGQTEGAA